MEDHHSSDSRRKRPRLGSKAESDSAAPTPSKLSQQTSGEEADQDLIASLSRNESGKKFKLRVEAMFFPKFDNEHRTDKSIRQSIKSNIVAGKGFAEVTLKHSGSLLLWSGGQRFYSKNSASNAVTLVGEILLRQHFYRTARLLQERNREQDNHVGKKTEEALYQKCSNFVQKHHLTLAFEVVSSVLGDHGGFANRDYLILTAVGDRSRKRFYSTLELLQVALELSLPHNDIWTFSSSSSFDRLMEFYDTSRETGMATSTRQAMTLAAEIAIPSMYPHEVVHSELLEGFVIRYVPYNTVKGKPCGDNMEQIRAVSVRAQERLHQMTLVKVAAYASTGALNDEESTKPILSVNCRELMKDYHQSTVGPMQQLENTLQGILDNSGPRTRVLPVSKTVNEALQKCLPVHCDEIVQDKDTDLETKQIALVLQTLTRIGARVHYSVFCEENDDGRLRWLCMVHVRFDRTFQKYRQEQKDINQMKDTQMPLMDLYRGFCVEICTDKQSTSPVKDNRSNLSSGATDADVDGLILKMKFIPYMIRTFGCRNGIRFVKDGGLSRYNDYIRDLISRWQISTQATQKWMPFLRAWGEYSLACFPPSGQRHFPVLASPPLREETYLRHFDHFQKLYEKGKISSASSRSSKANRVYKGLTIVLALDCDTAKQAAEFIAKQWLDGSQLLEGGVESLSHENVILHSIQGRVCWGEVGKEKLRKLKLLKELDKKSISLLLVGCSEPEINAFYREVKDQRRYIGQSNSWRNSCAGAVVDVPKSFMSSAENESSIRARSELWRVSDSITAIDTRPGLLVFFPAALPGSGKSTLLGSDTVQKLNDAMQSIVTSMGDTPNKMEKRSVSVLVGDQQQRKVKFWQQLKESRLSNNSAITIADKNVPLSTWDMVAQICSATNARAVPIIPEESGVFETTFVEGIRCPDEPEKLISKKHLYPFSLWYLAVCICRVLKREGGSHAGKLDVKTKYACMIVVKFFAFYRGILAEDFQEAFNFKMAKAGALVVSKPVILPVFSQKVSTNLPGDLNLVLKEALQVQLGWETKKADIEKNTAGGYIDKLEASLREVVGKHSSALLESTTTKFVSQKLFVLQFSERLLELDGLSSLDTFVKIVSIDVPRSSVQSVLKQCNSTALGHELNVLFPSDNSSKFVDMTHLTLCHYTQLSQGEIRETFRRLLGQEVALEVTTLLWNERIAALAVNVAQQSLDGSEVPRPQNEFAHITIWHRDDVSPAEANSLPGLVSSGQAQGFSLSEKISLTGKVSFWPMDQH